MMRRCRWSWRLLGWIEVDSARDPALRRVWYFDRVLGGRSKWAFQPYWHAESLYWRFQGAIDNE